MGFFCTPNARGTNLTLPRELQYILQGTLIPLHRRGRPRERQQGPRWSLCWEGWAVLGSKTEEPGSSVG